uniref:Zinc finger C2HC domain-containing protein 1A n=1 Tax=Labrus bergylta TaxID=56723 RepID=A0A3Q3GSI0_9LABR
FSPSDAEAPPAEDLLVHTAHILLFLQEKHAKICQKSVVKRRKTFDSSRQRAEGTDISVLKPIKPKAEPPKKPSNWRKKHEDFIATIRAAKNITQAMKDGGPLPPPPPPTYDPDYVQCPFCERRFNESAADRHIKFCQEKAARMPNKGKLGDAKKPPARTESKPPALVKKMNSPAVSTIPSASSRLPQRSGLGQPSGNGTAVLMSPHCFFFLIHSRLFCVFQHCYLVNFVTFLRNDVDGSNDIANGGMKSKFCHACGTRFPVESAKFCCECGVKRMCL